MVEAMRFRTVGTVRRPVIVVNTGVGSDNTVQQRAVLERYGELLNPELVLLLYVYDDVDEHARPFDPHAQFDLDNYDAVRKVEVILGKRWLHRITQHIRKKSGAQARIEAAPAWVDVAENRLSIVDGHPNAKGHELIAKGLARDLQTRGWLPAPR